MTENRTTELREKLTERGVEYTTNDGEHVKETCWPYMGELMAVFAEFDNGTTCFACDTWCFTPEQAIAATMGGEREKRLEKLVRIYGEISNYFCERFACCDAEFANCKYCIGLPPSGQCELGWCNDESKALGMEQPDYGGGKCEPVNLQELYDRISELENERATHGTLTAEQVREAIEKRFDFDVWVPAERWQAIADELNAELGSGTCELHYGEDDDGYDGWYCDECGGWFQAVGRDGHLVEPKHCQECGAKVVG